MDKLSNKQYWDNEWDSEVRSDISSFLFEPLIKKYIPNINNKTYFEIGCAPGTIMAFFNKTYSCKVSGIDYSSPIIIDSNMRKNNISDYQLFNEDFLTFNNDKQYDIVASFGFIEHFSNTTAIFEKHNALLKNKGYLIIEMPNLRYFNKVIYSIFNRDLLKMHNLDVMNLKCLRNMAINYDIIYCNYYKSTLFEFNSDNVELIGKPLLNKIFRFGSKLIKTLKLDNIPNRFFSPYIVLIAQKK